jgi:hypothetical protein
VANHRIEYQIKEAGMSKPSVVRAYRRRGIKVAPEVLRAGVKLVVRLLWYLFYDTFSVTSKNVKLPHYTPWRRLGREDV